MTRCECDWYSWHQGNACPNEAHDHGDVRTSPQLCMPCLMVCMAEQDEAEDSRVEMP